MNSQRQHLTPILVLSLTLSCGGSGGSGPPPIGVPSPVIYGLDSLNTLVVFRASRPDLVTRTTAVTGLPAGQHLVGIDFRPADGKLYGLASGSRLYLIDTTSGAATPVGTAVFVPALVGSAFGVDFDPVTDQLRVMSDSGLNLRLDPVADTVAGQDTALAFASGDPHAGVAPVIAAAAYTNSAASAATTTLYGIDAGLGVLVTATAPGSGQLTTVASLGVPTTTAVGFDIDASTGTGYITLTAPTGGASQFYAINVVNRTVTLTGTVGHAVPLVGISVHP